MLYAINLKFDNISHFFVIETCIQPKMSLFSCQEKANIQVAYSF